MTSNSTEAYDRGEKLRHYRAIGTAREIVIVSHREPRITLHRRGDDDRWISVDAVAGDSVTLDSIAAVLHATRSTATVSKTRRAFETTLTALIARYIRIAAAGKSHAAVFR